MTPTTGMLLKTTKPTALSNAAAHILRATVSGDRPLWVRRSGVLAESGDLTFRHAPKDARDRMRRTIKSKGWLRVKNRDIAADAQLDAEGELAGPLANAGNLKAHRATGDGEILLGHRGGDVTVFSVVDDRVVFLDQAEILAYDDTLVATLESTHVKEIAMVIGTDYGWILSGSGDFATATTGETIVLEVRPDRSVRFEVEALLAHTAGVEVTITDDYVSRISKRGAKWLLKVIPKLNVDLGRERVWLQAHGRGQLVIRASD